MLSMILKEYVLRWRTPALRFASPKRSIAIRFVPNRPRTGIAPRYVHGLAGTLLGVRVREIMHKFDAVAQSI